MRQHRGFSTAIVSAVIALFLFPTIIFAASHELAEKQVFRWGHHTTDISSLDPAFSTADPQYSCNAHVMNGLVRLKPGTLDFENLEGDLAKSWDLSEDGKVYIFHLRQGVQWHRGYGEFTAEDVKYTFDRQKSKELGSPYSAKYQIIDEIKILDKYTVQFILKRPSPFFLLDQVLAYQGGLIVSKKQGEEQNGATEKMGIKLIGTGPFMVEEYRAKEKIVLVKNPDYFRGAPTLEKVEFNFMSNVASRTMAFKGGELDGIYGKRDPFWVKDIKGIGTTVVTAVPLGSGSALHFNMTKKPLDNIKVRKALALVLNRPVFESYFGDIWTEMPAPVPAAYYGALPKDKIPEELLYEGTFEEAKKLLAEAGYEDGFKLEGFITDKPYYKDIFTIAQNRWAKIGVDFKVKVVDHTTFHANIRNDMNDVVIYYAGRAPVADSYLTQFYHADSIVTKKTGITNFSHYGDVDANGDGKIDNIDDLIEDAQSEVDQNKQLELYYKAQMKLLKDVPSKPLHSLTKVLVRHDWVDLGVDFDGTMIFGYPLEKARILKH